LTVKSSPPKQREYDIFADPRIPEVLRAWAKLNDVEWGGSAHSSEVMHSAGVQDGKAVVNKNGITAAGKCILSFLARQAYQEKGEDGVLKKLPFLLLVDCSFFLKEPWVRTLIAGWYSRQEADKINQAFFGQGAREKRAGGGTLLWQFQRDMEVVAVISILDKRKFRGREAYRWVDENFDGISAKNAERICRQFNEGYPALRFFSYAERVLLMRHFISQAYGSPRIQRLLKSLSK
jgi:hypothetical protein